MTPSPTADDKPLKDEGPSGASGASGSEEGASGASGASGSEEGPTGSQETGHLQVEPDAPPTSAAVVNAINGTPANEEESFSLDRLVEEANAFFGEPPFVVAGALHPAREAGVAELTREQAQAAINSWLEAPVV